MINRRSFLKLSGIAALALSAGYSTGKFLNTRQAGKYSLYAFLPEDVHIINQVVEAFHSKINSGYIPIFETNRDKGILSSIIRSSFNKINLLSNNRLNVKLTNFKQIINSDILISNSEKYMLTPKLEFDNLFSSIRGKIKGRNASLFLSLEYQENNFLNSLFKSDNKIVIIENDKGIVDKINLNKSYKDIEIKGLNGKTYLTIENGFAKVSKSSCRHKLCEKKGFISKTGEVIVCAPEKLLIRVENI